METIESFEVNLSRITGYEMAIQSQEKYAMTYIPATLTMLEVQGESHLTKEDLLKKFSGMSVEEVLMEYPHIRYAGLNRMESEGMEEEIYFDLMADIVIDKNYLYYDRFFAYLLKYTDIMRIDECLDYQLVKHHDNNATTFLRFLQLVLRKFELKILTQNTVLTVREWIASQQQQLKTEETNEKDLYKGKRNGKIKRSSNDNITALNRDQTVLLIQYLRENKILLKDENLNDADAGKAFELLTGYSQHTLRQELGKYYLLENRENLKKLYLMLTQLANYVNHIQKKLYKPGGLKLLVAENDSNSSRIYV